MTIRLRSLLCALLGLALAAGAIYWSGIVSISASSGHWAVTDWFLHTAMRRSVKFHARGIDPPDDLSSETLVRRAAGHYETGCAPCHGSPARPRGAVPPAITPPPPPLEPKIAEWQPEQLFWIVKHGVKFSAMPAWPALERDDEVWAMTAFLLALPEMTPDAYLALAYGEAGPELSAPGGLSLAARPPLRDCVRCHGRDGLGHPDGAFPRLDIQSRDYLLAALAAFRRGTRESGIMESAVRPLAATELTALAEHYAEPGPIAPAPLPASAVAPELLARGAAIARHGIPEQGVGACLGCHDPAGETHRPDFPRLDGQYRNYLELQLALFASETRRGGGAFAELMSAATHSMEPDDIAAVSAFFASRDPRRTAPPAAGPPAGRRNAPRRTAFAQETWRAVPGVRGRRAPRRRRRTRLSH